MVAGFSPPPPLSSPRCSLWVSGLVSSVRAMDLQTLFSPYGQVWPAALAVVPQPSPSPSLLSEGHVSQDCGQVSYKATSIWLHHHGNAQRGGTLHSGVEWNGIEREEDYCGVGESCDPNVGHVIITSAPPSPPVEISAPPQQVYYLRLKVQKWQFQKWQWR